MNPSSNDKLDVRPFRAYRYNPAKVNFQKVIAPPYDVISPEKQDHLYGLSPFNAVRLILNKKEQADCEHFNSYTRARDYFNMWIQDQILIRDDNPCFYVYRQSYMSPEAGGRRRERTALLGRVKLEPFEKGRIIPHEKTLQGPRADRMKLIKMTEANLSPVFGLYKDEGGRTHQLIEGAVSAAGSPVFDLVDEDGIGHTLWVVSDHAVCRQISDSLADKKVYIADGHHRYETALEYARIRREEDQKLKTPPKGLQPYEFTLMAFVSFSDPGFMVMPTHRLMTQLPMPQPEIMKKLKTHFQAEEMAAEKIEKNLNESKDLPVKIGLVFKDKSYLLTLKDTQATKRFLNWDRSDISLDLNVNILGALFFTKLLDFSEEKWEANLRFEHEVVPAIEAVKKGRAEAAFLLKAAPVEMLEKLGAVHERMPQKSTYFFPKLASGIVFHHHSV